MQYLSLYGEDKEVKETMRAVLHKRAIGYSVDLTEQSFTGDGKAKVVLKTVHIPADPKAMASYINLFQDQED